MYVCTFLDRWIAIETGGGVIQSESKSWRIGMLMVQDSLSPTAREQGVSIFEGRIRWISQLKQREQIHPSSPFCSIQPLSRLDDAHPCG